MCSPSAASRRSRLLKKTCIIRSKALLASLGWLFTTKSNWTHGTPGKQAGVGVRELLPDTLEHEPVAGLFVEDPEMFLGCSPW